MDRHPGGPTTILAWAGKDASKFFNDIHKGVKMLGFVSMGCLKRLSRVSDGFVRGVWFVGVEFVGTAVGIFGGVGFLVHHASAAAFTVRTRAISEHNRCSYGPYDPLSVGLCVLLYHP